VTQEGPAGTAPGLVDVPPPAYDLEVKDVEVKDAPISTAIHVQTLDSNAIP